MERESVKYAKCVILNKEKDISRGKDIAIWIGISKIFDLKLGGFGLTNPSIFYKI